MSIDNLHTTPSSRRRVNRLISSNQDAELLFERAITTLRESQEEDEVLDIIRFTKNIEDLLQLLCDELTAEYNDVQIESYRNGKVVAVINKKYDFLVTDVGDTTYRELYNITVSKDDLCYKDKYEKYVFTTIHQCLLDISKETNCI